MIRKCQALTIKGRTCGSETEVRFCLDPAGAQVALCAWHRSKLRLPLDPAHARDFDHTARNHAARKRILGIRIPRP